MGIKHPVCQMCNHVKESEKHKCAFPNERGTKMNYCSGRAPYKWIYKEAATWVMQNYKTFR